MQTWLLLLYKLAPQPTARRVYLWRKLKRLGAILMHDAVWVLPATSRTREQFQWLVSEIGEMHGEAWLWEGQLATEQQDAALVQQFSAQVDGEYGKMLAALKRKNANLDTLARRYQQTQVDDYFQSPLGKQVRDALIAARTGGAR